MQLTDRDCSIIVYPGKAVAINLISNLPPSSKITIAGRNRSSVESLLTPDVDFQPIDAALMTRVKEFSADYIRSIESSTLPQVDLLVMSQGILSTRGRTPTSPENIDLKMALYYYSRMLLIKELLPVLSPTATVLSILDGKRSDIHASSINWDDLDLAREGSYGLSAARNHCSSMTDAMMEAFAAHEQEGRERVFIHSYPGVVDTTTGNSNSDLPVYARMALSALLWVAAVSPEKCAEYMLQGVATVRNKGKGRYNIDERGREVVKEHIGDNLRGKVWDHTLDLIDSQPNPS
jgi:hypothetical protein